MSTEMIWEMRSTSSADTEQLGEALGRLLQPPVIIELRADLGGGKTTFVRGLAVGLGSSDPVSSPTFTINKVYKADQATIYHFDFYRLAEAGIIKEQLEEALEDPAAVVVIEWSDIVADVLPAGRLIIDLRQASTSSDERDIYFHYREKHSTLIKQLETDWSNLRP